MGFVAHHEIKSFFLGNKVAYELNFLKTPDNFFQIAISTRFVFPCIQFDFIMALFVPKFIKKM